MEQHKTLVAAALLFKKQSRRQLTSQLLLQVVDAANILIQDDSKVGTVLLVMAKYGVMEWVPAKQNLRPLKPESGTEEEDNASTHHSGYKKG